MAKRLFVGGLPWAVTDQELQDLFSKHGQVVSAKVITDKFTGRSKGFGFVEFATDEEADAATKALNETELQGRKIVVNEARPMEQRNDGGERKYQGGRRDDRRGGYRGQGGRSGGR